MPQSVAQLPVCSECGSEALGQALFCFHCGSRLKVEEQKTDTAREKKSDEIPSKVDKPIQPPEGEPFDALADETEDEEEVAEKIPKPDQDEDPMMRTASAIRQGEGMTRLRRIETRWTPDSESVNIWFIVGSLVLLLAALAVFFISLNLR